MKPNLAANHSSQRSLTPMFAVVREGERELAVIGVLLAYVAVWTLYGVLSKGSQDVHFDMAEMVAWSRELALGYPKHPSPGAHQHPPFFSGRPSRSISRKGAIITG
jgi:hypothetical protein